jgi:hypothetical protein
MTSVSRPLMRLLLPEPLLPMKTVSGVNSTTPLSRTALKRRRRKRCGGSLELGDKAPPVGHKVGGVIASPSTTLRINSAKQSLPTVCHCERSEAIFARTQRLLRRLRLLAMTGSSTLVFGFCLTVIRLQFVSDPLHLAQPVRFDAIKLSWGVIASPSTRSG